MFTFFREVSFFKHLKSIKPQLFFLQANHTVMHWAIENFKSINPSRPKPHIITTNIEHCATELPLKQWQKESKIDVTFVPVNTSTGKVEVDKIQECIRPNTCLVTIMMANNETGVIQPIAEIGQLCQNRDILFHTDAAQAFGKIKVSIQDFPVDYITIVGHKFYGPRIGAIYHKTGVPNTPPIFYGGGQELGRRSGTENTPMAIGLGVAAELITLSKDFQELLEKRELFISKLKEKLDLRIKVNFENSDRLPNTASICFVNLDAGVILQKLEQCIEASRSAACHSGTGASNVLIKSGLSLDEANSTIRFSVGRNTTFDDILKATYYIKNVVDEIN